AVRVRVLPRVLCDLRARSFAVAIEGEGGAVLENRHDRRVGEDVLQAVAGLEPELVASEKRIAVDEDVRDRVLVVQEAGHGQLAGHDAAAEPWVALEHEDLLARCREVCGGDEPVVAGADRDDVVGVAHASCCRMYPVSMYSRTAYTRPSRI